MNTDLHTVNLPIKDYNELLRTRERNYKQILLDVFGENMVVDKDEAREVICVIGGVPYSSSIATSSNHTRNFMWGQIHSMLLRAAVMK